MSLDRALSAINGKELDQKIFAPEWRQIGNTGALRETAAGPRSACDNSAHRVRDISPSRVKTPDASETGDKIAFTVAVFNPYRRGGGARPDAYICLEKRNFHD